MDKTPTAEQVVIEVMRHFGFRRNYQVAEYFKVTPQTLSGWIKAGEIPPKHLLRYTNDILADKGQENFDKTPEIQGKLNGIKGQYLFLNDEYVLNIRKYTGYIINCTI